MTGPLWTTADFLTATGGRLVGAAPREVTGLSIDSRTLEPGDAFFAIRGERLDGHEFVATAFARGAALAVVAEERAAALGTPGPLLVVPDVPAALVALAVAARGRSAARIAAITGSVGKTSSKQMLALALASQGPAHASPASFNNQWGVPLTLARMPRSVRYGVFEIGMNHAGEITPLVKLVRPQVAVITAVEPVHLEFFNSVNDIARAKAEIFAGLEPGGAALLNRDNDRFDLLAELARAAGVSRIVGFGEHPRAEVRLVRTSSVPGGSVVEAGVLGKQVSYRLAAPGRHMVQNSVAVLGAAALLGADVAKAAAALASFAPDKGRGGRLTLTVAGGTAVLIDESYNANPASMGAAIALLGEAAPTGRGRRIAVLGDMRELGATAPALHAALRQSLEEARVDRVFLAGPLMGGLWDALPSHLKGGYGENAGEIEEALVTAIAPGDVVMVKGSNASRMSELVEALRRRHAAKPGTAREEDAA